MFRTMFSSRPTTKGDVVIALFGAFFGCWKLYDTMKDYNADQLAAEMKELEK